ncbi:MAG TPA: histidine kinase [Puia sp.]|nr:histidine kinase [Puia sp.]
MNLLEKLLDLHNRRRWLAHLLFWLAVLLEDVSSSHYHDGSMANYGFELLSDFLYMIPEILAAYAITYWLIPRMLFKRHYIRATLSFLVIAWLACALGRIFVVRIDEPLAGIRPKASETWLVLFTDFRKLLYNYFFEIFSMVFIFLCLKTLKDQLLIRQHTLVLEKERTETELKLLKAQLNPHFLFNTLNNIYSLSFTSPQRTSASIAGLANILDHILHGTQQKFVPLQAEIGLIRNYIELEKLRYDNRLTVDFNIDGDTDTTIAPLILLSLVENAFKHGASNDVGEPVIDIRLTVSSSHITFVIKNTVVKPKGQPAGIGLTNLRQQLRHLYGAEHELLVSEADGWFRVSLTINHTLHEENKMLAGRR